MGFDNWGDQKGGQRQGKIHQRQGNSGDLIHYKNRNDHKNGQSNDVKYIDKKEGGEKFEAKNIKEIPLEDIAQKQQQQYPS